jgi:hypothetical protein
MLTRRLDEVAEWQLTSSGRPEVLHGLWKSHRFDALSRFLLPRLTADFAQPGDLVRVVSASIAGTHVIGLANLTRRRALLPNPARYAAAALFICGLPAAAGFLLGRLWLPATFLTIALLAAAWIFAEAVSQLRHYVVSGSAGSFTLWRSIRERVATRPLPPPDAVPRAEPNWTSRLASAVGGKLQDTQTCPIGHVIVADGRLSPCEPFRLLDDAPANAIEVPPGRYPVFVAIACSEYYDGKERVSDRRVSHAWVQLDDSKAVLWRLARQGRKPIEVGVDSAIACFTSVEAARRLAASWDKGGQFGYVDELGHEIVTQMRRTERGGWYSAAIGEDLVAFSSGTGDGVYSVYLGMATGGETAAVAIDFEIQPERVEEPWRGRYEIIWS